MFDRLKKLYDQKKLTLQGLANAVMKGLITSEEFYEISGEKYDG